MDSKDLKGARGAGPRFFSKASLLLTILPLWALWVYAYASLVSLQREVEALPRFYGMYLYKENVSTRLEEAARLMGLFEDRRAREIEGGRVDGLTEEERGRFDLLFGPDEALVVVERPGLRILYPSEPPYGGAEFLGDPEGRRAFFRTLQRMNENEIRGGYFSVDVSDASNRSDKRCWYLAVAPVGEDLLCILPVPEKQVRLSGGILEEAQKNLLEGRKMRFVSLTLPVVVLSSLFIWILYRQNRQSDRGRGT